MLHNQNANGNTALTLAEIQAACTSLHEEFQSKLSALQSSMDTLANQQPYIFCGKQFESERDALEEIIAWTKDQILSEVRGRIMDIHENMNIDNDCVEDYISIDEDEIEFSIDGREISVDNCSNAITIDSSWAKNLENDLKSECEYACKRLDAPDSESDIHVANLVDSFLHQ